MREVAKKLLEIGAVKLQPGDPFTWASGWKSPIYCDNRKALANVVARSLIVKELNDLWRGLPREDVIAGVATGAIAWGCMLANDVRAPFAYVRAKAKDHGLNNQIEGKIEKGDKVIIVEDLISTGKSSLSAVQAVRDAGAEVLGMIAIFSYELEQSKKAFEEAGVKLTTVTNYSELLDVAKKENLFDDQELELLAQWRLDPEHWGKEPDGKTNKEME